MIFFLFLFSYSEKAFVDKSNYKTVIKSSFSMPVFILMHSPHCGHCKKVFPIWKDLMNKYSKDKNVFIAACDVIENSEYCDKIKPVYSYPTFLILNKGRAKEIKPQRTIESFINETEHLKQLDFSFPCLRYPSDFTNEYPIAVFNGNSTIEDTCKRLKSFESSFSGLISLFYVNETVSNSDSIVAKYSNNQQLVYTSSQESITEHDFLQEYIYFGPFQDFNYSQAMICSRRIALYIHSTYSQPNEFLKNFDQYLFDFVFCKMHKKKFDGIYNYLNLSKTGLVISNKEKTKFRLFPNILHPNDIKETLDKIIAGEVEDSFDLDLSQIFPDAAGKRNLYEEEIHKLNDDEYINRLIYTNRDDEVKPNENAALFVGGFIFLVIIASIGIVIYTFIKNKADTAKIE